MNKHDVRILSQGRESVLSTNKVLRNTYLLLGLTFLFSGFTAYLSYAIGAQPVGFFAFILVSSGLMVLTNATKDSVWGLASIFALTGFMGFTLGPIFNFYLSHFSNGAQLITTAFGGTGMIFIALSAYVLTTRKDFSYLTGFLFIGICVALIAAGAALVFQLPIVMLGVSMAFMLLSSGLILMQTSEIIHGGETNYISATVGLYLSIYNLFVSLLNILGAFGGRD